MSIPTSSSSGRWYVGQTFTPPSGQCSEHTMEVVNPSVAMKQSITRTKEREQITRVGEVECVIARCQDCFHSITFPALAMVPDKDTTDESYADLALKVFEMLGEQVDE